MKKIFWISLLAIIQTGCTYSISQVHTEGTATDVIDTTQSPDTDVSPNLSIPASIIK